MDPLAANVSQVQEGGFGEGMGGFQPRSFWCAKFFLRLEHRASVGPTDGHAGDAT